MFREVVILTDGTKAVRSELFFSFNTLFRGLNVMSISRIFGLELNTKISNTTCVVGVWNM